MKIEQQARQQSSGTARVYVSDKEKDRELARHGRGVGVDFDKWAWLGLYTDVGLNAYMVRLLSQAGPV